MSSKGDSVTRTGNRSKSTNNEENQSQSSTTATANIQSKHAAAGDTSMTDATVPNLSITDASMGDATFHEISSSNISMPDATVQGLLSSNVSMLDAPSHNLDSSTADDTMLTAPPLGQDTSSILTEDSGNSTVLPLSRHSDSPTWAELSSGSLFGIHTNQTEDATASLSREFRGLNLTRRSPTGVCVDTPINTSFPPTETNQPPLHSSLANSQNSAITPVEAMDSNAAKPSYYIPVYVIPGQVAHVFGEPVYELPSTNGVARIEEEPDSEEDVTVRPRRITAAGPRSTSPMDDITTSEATVQSENESDASETEEDEMDEDEQDDDDEDRFEPVAIHELYPGSLLSTYDLEAVGNTLAIPHQLHRQWKATGYDPNWMQVTQTPETVLQPWKSKYKMDEVVNKGGLEKEDELVNVGTILEGENQGESVEKFGRIVEIGKAHGKMKKGNVPETKKLPNFALFVNGVRQTEVLKGCSGPEQLLQALSKCAPKTAMPKQADVWGSLIVRRAGTDMGKLSHVRQKLHRFEIEQKVWNDRMNPKPKAKGGKKKAQDESE